MNSYGIEWDEHKRQRLIAERKVDLLDAALIFENPEQILEQLDKRSDYGEKRYQAMGCVDGEWYFVVYTWRGNNRRIISAWRLDEHGKRRYQKLLTRRT